MVNIITDKILDLSLSLSLSPAPSMPSLYDYLCEAGNVGGYDTMVKGGPTPQSHLIVVGESPMISLYKISKVCHSY